MPFYAKIRTMLFRDMKPNYTVYILDKEEMTVKSGKVKTTSFPRMDTTRGTTQMVVDVEIEADGKTATYSIPENLALTYAGNLVLSTDRDGILHEVEAKQTAAEQILATVEKQKKIIELAKILKSELNPAYREKQETEKRFVQIEGAISEMKDLMKAQQDMMKSFIKKFES